MWPPFQDRQLATYSEQGILPLDSIAHAAHAVMAFCMGVLESLDRVPDTVWQQHAPPSWAMPLAMLGALWMLLPRGFPARCVGVAKLVVYARAHARGVTGA